METAMAADPSPDSSEAIQAKIAENQEFIVALEGGHLHIGAPHEGRTEAKIFDLKRENNMWQSILDKRNAPRS
jgi:hypothetical protein